MRVLRAVATSGGSGEGAVGVGRWRMESMASVGVLLDAILMAQGPVRAKVMSKFCGVLVDAVRMR
jgi:hypothetical protein